MNETRKAKHIRILQNGHRKTLDDYREIQYLRDKGLANAEVQISYARENYGQPINALWGGPTAAGRDYLEELLQEQFSKEENVNSLPNNHSQENFARRNVDPGSQEPQKARTALKKTFYQASKTTRFLVITIIVAVIGAVSSETIARLLVQHFEFFQ